jgi:branched-chain amino acid transport system ATP-binding protein
VGRPELLLLDEPSVGIQPSIVQEIGESLTRLNREEGLSILLVEQNIGLISHIAQRAYAMDKGSVVATLTKDALQRREVLVEYLAI